MAGRSEIWKEIILVIQQREHEGHGTQEWQTDSNSNSNSSTNMYSTCDSHSPPICSFCIKWHDDMDNFCTRSNISLPMYKFHRLLSKCCVSCWQLLCQNLSTHNRVMDEQVTISSTSIQCSFVFFPLHSISNVFLGFECCKNVYEVECTDGCVLSFSFVGTKIRM